ncbi:unnamed protein product [Rotaria sp. Silwood2]|nr:unnamed protein product [Rotaria sp. Silwood2]CAF4335709.1 unnamed protein product [Rotaria sp. Silwood2]
MSGFDLSSRNISLNGTILRATCKRADGTTDSHATLDLNSCIANINGSLVPRSGGNFAASCSQIRLNGTVLSCMANGIDDNEVSAQLDLSNFIANSDGELVASE